ncbi:MAG: M20/M25/M40 family metallo-hydrolase [Firmicutes bacterium]|nr:M20/M25/M40 family metallo-hydrolase [Bacillota bacterium]
MTGADINRMTEQFMALSRMDSESFHEKGVAAWLKAELKSMGFVVYEDDAGKHYGSEAGNLYGILKGEGSASPVLFSAHMDTVKPGIGKVPILKDGRIESEGETVLGADDICGIVEILEGIRIVKAEEAEDKRPAGDIEVLFTIAEEVYGKGAAVFDFGRIKSKDAYVLDMSGAPGAAARKAPSIISFEIEIKGRASHAGFKPEAGINALEAAAKAIARIRQGRVSEESTLNIGTIEAGRADNIVAENCRCTGEVRSFSHEEALRLVEHVKKTFAEEAEALGAEIRFTHTVRIKAYETNEDARVCRHFRSACRKLGLAGELKFTHGGSDNNIFAQKGIEGIVVANGMYKTHSTTEYELIDDMKTGAELVAALIRERQDI